ncbi:hypothetical protein B0H34DRAFT_718256 [Crassisporium funariophilum]|nr:hypothetical protein B0H34DRAFT_718256 [Crassisporium funariophilum]
MGGMDKGRYRRSNGATLDTTVEAPPSVLPHLHLCDITGLEAPYTDPATGLRYHDKSVYEIVKALNVGMAKDYLSARGVNSIVK